MFGFIDILGVQVLDICGSEDSRCRAWIFADLLCQNGLETVCMFHLDIRIAAMIERESDNDCGGTRYRVRILPLFYGHFLFDNYARPTS